MASTGSGSRTKGADFERKTAVWLGKWWKSEFHRTPGSGSLHWDKANNVAGDIVAPSDAGFPFVVECKKHDEPTWTLENLVLNTGDIKNWWQQVVTDALSVAKIPMLIFSRNRSKTFIALPYKEEVFHYIEDTTDNYLVSTISYKGLAGQERTYKVLVFAKEVLEATDKSFWISYAPSYTWDFHIRKQDSLKEKNKTNVLQNLLNTIEKEVD